MTEERFTDPVLRLLLNVIAIFLLVQGMALIFIPGSRIEAFFEDSLLRQAYPSLWKSSALLFYMLRTCGVLYAWVGIFFYMAAKDPQIYIGMIRLSGAMLFILALTCAIAGYNYKFPTVLYVADVFLASIGGYIAFRAKPAVPALEAWATIREDDQEDDNPVDEKTFDSLFRKDPDSSR